MQKKVDWLKMLVLSLLLTSILATRFPVVKAQPVLDDLWFRFIQGSPAITTALQLGTIDVYTTLTTPDDFAVAQANGQLEPRQIQKLAEDGFTISSTPGYHFSYIAFNLRWTDVDGDGIPEAGYPARESVRCLLDPAFRLAVAHLIPKEEIIGTMFRWTAVRSDTPCPPALGRFFQDTPKYPFNPDIAVHILEDAGYWQDPTGQWHYPEGDPIGPIRIVSPTRLQARTSFKIVQMLVTEMHNIGLDTIQDSRSFPFPLVWITMFHHQFDMYFGAWGLGRRADFLWDFFHSDNDVPYGYNTPGVNETTINHLAEIMKTSLNLTEVIAAAREIQLELMDVTRGNPACLCYIPIYSLNCFDVYNPDLSGIINMLGRGTYNKWTLVNLRWPVLPGGVSWGVGYEPYILNPLYSTSAPEWAIMGAVYDRLIEVDPYTNDDLPGLAIDWTWEVWRDPPIPPGVTGMRITFTIREGVEWHCGGMFTAEDVQFAYDYINEWQPPCYTQAWNWYVQSEVIEAPVPGVHAGVVEVFANTTSFWLPYEYARVGGLLPQHIWDEVRPGGAVFDGHPRNFQPIYTPHPMPFPKQDDRPWLSCLEGTGPWVIEEYNEPLGYVHLVANSDPWWMSPEEVAALLEEQFYWAGDVNRDGVIDGEDLSLVGMAFGSYPGHPNWDPRCDIAPRHPFRADLHPVDEFIDLEDLYVVGRHLGAKKEFP